MNINPVEMVKMFMRKGGTPKELLQKAITENNSNPMIDNLMKMAVKGDSKGIENFARNYMKEQGRDFDKEFSEFRKNFK